MERDERVYKFKSLVTTADFRLRKGKEYEGTIVSTSRGLRVLLYEDNHWEKMTFDPKVFIEVSNKLLKGWGSNL